MSNDAEHKLYHFEVSPSAKNWDAISTALDHQSMSFVDKLHHYEQTPLAESWNKIEAGLNAGPGASAVPFVKRFSRPLKYIGAACILVLAVTTINLLVNKNAVADEISALPSGKQPVTQPVSGKDKEGGASIEKQSNEIDKPSPTTNAFTQRQVQRQISSRYLTIADEDGKKVRLSKKAYTVFNCAENTAALNNSRCKENIEAMRQKMAASILSSSGDFAGLIDMIKTLQENR